MNQLIEHNNSLRSLYESYENNDDVQKHNYVASLNEIDNVMRKVLGIELMKESGTFFTGDELAEVLLSSFRSPFNVDSVILDPTCGAGNLLIACSRRLPIEKGLQSTLLIWGRILWGGDLFQSFVEATKLRIIIEAINRGCEIDCNLDTAYSLLSNIKVFDALDATAVDIKDVTHLVMNPPFCNWSPPKNSFWKQGNVNAAAVVLEHYLRISPSQTQVSSILPDVLRSGSRYGYWRDMVQSYTSCFVNIIGRFNRKTDVDVFILAGETTNGFEEKIDWLQVHSGNVSTIADSYEVSVGKLVAYRDKEEGTDYPYIHPKNVPAWSEVANYPERRKFLGKAVLPPFVVIRRTSSPSDKFRAIGAIIDGKEPIAVENHLIVVKPLTGGISECRKLLRVLKSEETNKFLNVRIRCRHLTVEAVKEIPYSD
ncbi:hypothetical protein J2X32_004048 [Rheinheimera pacifica]|uniref:N-6 DNA methylase n=1 Tax=Rheinheimera pacifica TaxID=173990 RepID=UPI002862C99F|nr:N-6 DNA methylase [Rheinheimera pacifica]MDR6985383.1 hypothetical protein [Rheinheimera pacifica]